MKRYVSKFMIEKYIDNEEITFVDTGNWKKIEKDLRTLHKKMNKSYIENVLKIVSKYNTGGEFENKFKDIRYNSNNAELVNLMARHFSSMFVQIYYYLSGNRDKNKGWL